MLTYQFTKNVDVHILYGGWPYVINIYGLSLDPEYSTVQ